MTHPELTATATELTNTAIHNLTIIHNQALNNPKTLPDDPPALAYVQAQATLAVATAIIEQTRELRATRHGQRH